MFNNLFINIILHIKNFIMIYFIYIFNLLYYTIFYNNAYKCLKNFKVKGVKELYYSYTLGSLTMDILLRLRISRFLYIMFFYIFYLIYIYNIIEIYIFNKFLIKLNIFKFLINFLELHYNVIMKIHLLKIKIYFSDNPSKYKFWQRSCVYNIFFMFYFIYFKICILKFKFILFQLYLWSFTYYIRFLIKIKNNKKKYTIKYNWNKIKHKIFLKINNIINKIFQNYNIKMTLKYYYNKIKKYLINIFNLIVCKIKNFFFIIKEFYFIHIVNAIIFKLLKNKGNFLFYYIFLFFKYFKSFLIWFTVKLNYNFFNKLKWK